MFELVTRRQNWGEDRVWFHDQEGHLASIPTSWTDVAVLDPFVVVAACPYRKSHLAASSAGLSGTFRRELGTIGPDWRGLFCRLIAVRNWRSCPH